MSFAEEANSDVPTLPGTHSGIPTYLLDKARSAKVGVFDGRTKPVRERQRLPVVPQGIERDEFLAALADLKEQLGSEFVEVNDKPLKDGWYMERQFPRLRSFDPQTRSLGFWAYPSCRSEYTRHDDHSRRGRARCFRRRVSLNHGGGAEDRSLGEQAPYPNIPHLHGAQL